MIDLESLENLCSKATPGRNHRCQLLALVVDHRKLKQVAAFYKTSPADVQGWITGFITAPMAVMTNLEAEWRKCPRIPDYEVNEYGFVRRSTNARTAAYRAGRPLRGRVCADGYFYYVLRKSRAYVRIGAAPLVLEAFHGPKPTPNHQAAHNDGDRLNNHYRNLRWATPQENGADKVKHGTSMRGEAHPFCKLSERQVSQIRADKRPSRAIAEEFGVSPTTIQRIRKGDLWAFTFSTPTGAPSHE